MSEHTPDTSTSPAASVPPLGSIHRGIWADSWAGRSPDNKLSCIALDASRRLKGLGDVLLSIALCATTPKHELEKFSFLAEAVNDIADALAAALKAIDQEQRAAEDAKYQRDRKQANKRAGKRSRRAAA